MRAAPAARPCFTVLDALGGFARLVRRTPTLDGAVPLRAAQACLPLLAGNALGWQVVISEPLRVAQRLTGPTLRGADDGLAQRHAAASARQCRSVAGRMLAASPVARLPCRAAPGAA